MTTTGKTSAWMTVLLCFVVAAFEGVDLQAAGLVAPKIAPLFKLTPSQMGWFFSASTIGLVIGAMTAGRLADRHGRKITLIVSIAVFGLFSVITAWSTSYEMLVVTRFLTGLGLGGALPNLIALSAENVPPQRRNLAVSLMYCGMPFGGGLASLLIALGAGGEGWQGLFYIGGIAPLAAIPVLWVLLPESRAFRAVEPVKATVPAALFGEGRAARTLALWTAFFCGLIVLYLLLNWLPTLLVGRGLSRNQASLVQAAFNLVGVVGAVTVGGLMDSPARRWAVAGVFVALGAGLAIQAAAPATFGIALLTGSLVGAAVLGAQSALYNLAPGLYPTAVRGTGLGAAVAAGRLGSVAGPLMAGALVGQGRSAGEVLTALLPMVAISGVAALWLAWRPPVRD
jgi:AAHS family 3-hydroxyphenylpropionic acid transporter